MENTHIDKKEAMKCGESIVDYYTMHYPSYSRLVSTPEKLKNLEVEFAKSCYENNINFDICMKALKFGIDNRDMVPQGRKPFLDDVAAIRAEERRKNQQDELLKKREIPKVTDDAYANVLHHAAKNSPTGMKWLKAIRDQLNQAKNGNKFNAMQVANDVGYPEAKMKSTLRQRKAKVIEIEAATNLQTIAADMGEL